MSLTIGIVGAGIVGRLVALECIKRNMIVTIFDDNEFSSRQNCSSAAAGMLAPISELSDANSLVYELGKRSLELWPLIVSRTGSSIFFQRQGTILLAHPRERAELAHLTSNLKRKLADCHEPLDALVPLGQCDLKRLEPELGDRFSDGLLVQGEGQIDNRQILAALNAYLVASGVIYYESTQVSLVRPFKVTRSGSAIEFDCVIDCRGLGAKDDIKQLRGVRGELIVIHNPEVKLNRPIRLLHPRWPIYIVPRPGDHFLIGATSIESADCSPISVRSTLELLSSAIAVAPNLIHSSIVETRVQCRPSLPNNTPSVLNQNGLITINGLYRHGFLCGPAIAEHAVQHIGFASSQSSEEFRYAAIG